MKYGRKVRLCPFDDKPCPGERISSFDSHPNCYGVQMFGDDFEVDVMPKCDRCQSVLY